MHLHGIITGDIVGSKNIEPVLRQQLFTELETFLQKEEGSWIKRYETFRGDSLQCEALSPELSLRTALMIRAFLKAYNPQAEEAENMLREDRPVKGYFPTEFDIRLSIGIGQVDFIQEGKLATSDGEAFQLSGEGLDSLKQASHRLAVNTFNKSFDEQIEPSILLLDALIQKWTQNGAELVLYMLQNKKEEEIANLLGISQPAVNQRKKNAQWFAIEKLIQYFEKTVQSWK